MADMFSMISFRCRLAEYVATHNHDGVVSQVRVPLNTACELLFSGTGA
jgi:hypothetical protein